MKIRILKIGNYIQKLESWNLGNWELNLEIGILKNYFKIEFLNIKFENRNFEELFKNGSLKIKFKKMEF